MPDSNIKILQKETYLKMIENSVGTKLFNSLFVKYQNSGKISDVLNNGEFSCASFVSSILYLNKMIDSQTATVKTLREKLQKSPDWGEISLKYISFGDLIFWEKIKSENGPEHEHVGFAFNDSEAISTSFTKRQVDRHHTTYGTERERNFRRIITAFRYIGFK